MTSDAAILFYDIASAPPLRTFAPNPWKTRLALNLKGVKYRTVWIDMPDIAALREKLGVPANRTLPDGTPFHTLPLFRDSSTNTIIGDTFEIALHLDKTYPEKPSLILPGAIGLTAAFNAHVDGLFTGFTALCDSMPFDPRIADTVKTMFAKRFGANSFDEMQMKDDERESKLAAFEAALNELAKSYRHTGGTTDHLWRANALLVALLAALLVLSEAKRTPGLEPAGFRGATDEDCVGNDSPEERPGPDCLKHRLGAKVARSSEGMRVRAIVRPCSALLEHSTKSSALATPVYTSPKICPGLTTEKVVPDLRKCVAAALTIFDQIPSLSLPLPPSRWVCQ
ncbi:hypothetical protein MBLNU459_g6419t1 [Dothideomycetes sp. NU459]